MAFNNSQNDGEIDQSADILQLLNDICMNDEHSDVTFIVENTKIPAHKKILSLRSPYFHALLSGDFAEAKQDEIKLKVPLDAFKAILKYIYTGCVSLAALETHQIIEFYDLAEQYGFDSLKKINLDYLTANLTLDNCVSMLNAAHLYSLDDLKTACIKFMDYNSIKLLDHDTLKILPLTLLCSLLKRDTFYAPEVDIFKAICNWATNNPSADVKEALSTVRWSEMSLNEYLNEVLPCNILDPTELLQVINENRESSNTSGRIQCHSSYSEKDIDINLATAEYGAKTISGENESALLSGNCTDYDWRKDCTFHIIYEGHVFEILDFQYQKTLSSSSITVDLGDIRFINNINFLLMDKDPRSYSYYIDVSINENEYIRLFDRTHSHHRSWQNLYFQSRPVRFIKLVGTRSCNITQHRFGRTFPLGAPNSQQSGNRKYDSFDVVGLQAIYTTINYPEMVDGFIKPAKNVAKVEYGALVKGGGGTNMLNENSHEFTCHEADSYILLQLNQPYYIGSLRMLLGNNKNYLNEYSLYIDTSMNESEWKMAIDKQNETLSGWQDFDFVPRPALFIRIKGTQKDVTFICTYFECPRSPRKPQLKRILQ